MTRPRRRTSRLHPVAREPSHPPRAASRATRRRAVGRLGRVRRRAPGRARSSGATCSSPPSASTARRPAACSPTSTRRRSRIRKFEGNPLHPGSRGRNCAKGPATINQINDPERILYPLRASGARGAGKWERVELGRGARRHRRRASARRSWRAGATRSCTTSAGPATTATWTACSRPGASTATTPTPTCARPRRGSATRSGRAPTGRARTTRTRRFILLLSSHLEAGHYFNPHAQRIIEGKMAGAKLARDGPAAVEHRVDGRLLAADVAGHARRRCCWPWRACSATRACPTASSSRRWVNWRRVPARGAPGRGRSTFDALRARAARDTTPRSRPSSPRRRAACRGRSIVEVARRDRRARARAFATHVWRDAAGGNLGGWQVARALQFLVRARRRASARRAAPRPTPGTSPCRRSSTSRRRSEEWNELLFPREWPLAHYEMSFLLPHFLKEGRGRLDIVLHARLQPGLDEPGRHVLDGGAARRGEGRAARRAHARPGARPRASPTTCCRWATAAERHDLESQETHAAPLGRLPPARAARGAASGRARRFATTPTRRNPGEVWEEDEFWIELSWRIDPDGALGIRKYFESPVPAGREAHASTSTTAGSSRTRCRGCPAAAAAKGLDAARVHAQVRRVPGRGRGVPDPRGGVCAAERDGRDGRPGDRARGQGRRSRRRRGRRRARAGFPTPSRKLEIYSPTLEDWGWPEHALPGYIRSHVHRRASTARGEMLLLPTFRLPDADPHAQRATPSG